MTYITVIESTYEEIEAFRLVACRVLRAGPNGIMFAALAFLVAYLGSTGSLDGLRTILAGG